MRQHAGQAQGCPGRRHRPSRRHVLASLVSASALGGLVPTPAVPSLAERPVIPVPKGKVRILLDTDAHNHIDDQFAIAYAALSPDAIQIESVYAAPFVNRRVRAPEEGMLRSFDEIGRVMEALRPQERFPTLLGSRAWLTGTDRPVSSPAAEDMIERVMCNTRDDLYIVAIGAPTNVASALLLEPRMVERANVVWLGASPYHFSSAAEFNLQQDLRATRILFDSGVRLMNAPAPGVCENLRTNHEELARYVRGKSRIGDYLFDLFSKYRLERHTRKGVPYSNPIWDLGAIAWLVNPGWVQSALTPSPVLSETLSWLHDPHRHRIRVAIRIERDAIFADFFRKIASAPS